MIGVKPTVWRRIEVAAASSLADLHAAIQVAMGWEDIHLHRLRVLGRHCDSEGRDLAAIRLADFRLRAHYQQLTARERPKKVAIIACMRRLLAIVDAVLRSKTPWRHA